MMHAALESTTDAILVIDEANSRQRIQREGTLKFWGIPPHMMISAHASELWNYVSPQLKEAAGYLAWVQLSPRPHLRLSMSCS